MTILLHANGDRNKPISPADVTDEILPRWEAAVTAGSNDELIHLDISCRLWKRECLDLLQAFLQPIVPRIETLKIDDIIASLETSLGLDSLAFFNELVKDKNATALKTVNLDDNALGIRAVEIMQDLLSIPTTLTLENTGLSAESIVLLPVNPQIETIALGRNQLGAKGAEAVGKLLPKWESLRHFSYNGARPLVEGTRYICEGLNALPGSSLVSINLHDSNLNSGDEDDDPIHSFCSALEKCSNLQKLIVRDCSLTADGLKRLVGALQTGGVKLSRFDVAGNELEEAGATTLAEHLVACQLETLQVLEMDTNETEGLEMMVDFFRQTTVLRELDVSENLLEDGKVSVLLETKISSLQKLKATDTEVTKRQAQKLQGMYSEVKLDDEEDWVDGDDDEDEEVDDLAAQLGATNL